MPSAPGSGGPPPVWRIPDLERNRNISLFYSLAPQDGHLDGEQAREFFLRSKLTMRDLSQVWMLADFDEDGSLSLPEFLIAMHLIQAKRNGSQLPETTPDGLLPRQLKETDITPISDADAKAYGAAFKKLDLDATGYLAGSVAKPVLKKSLLPVAQLAQVWSLADMDEDGQLTCAEFALSMHLMRFLRKGLLLPNSIDGETLAAACQRIADPTTPHVPPSSVSIAPDGNTPLGETVVSPVSIPTRSRKRGTIKDPSYADESSGADVSGVGSPPSDDSSATVSDRQKPTKRGNRWVSFSSKRPAGYLRESTGKTPSKLSTSTSPTETSESSEPVSPVKAEVPDEKPPTDAFFLADENPFTNDSFANLAAREDAELQQTKVADPFADLDPSTSDPFSSADPFQMNDDDPFGNDEMFADPFSSTAKAIGDMPSPFPVSPMPKSPIGEHNDALEAVAEEKDVFPSASSSLQPALDESTPTPVPADSESRSVPLAANSSFSADPFLSASAGDSNSVFGSFDDAFSSSQTTLKPAQPASQGSGAFDPFASTSGPATSTSGAEDTSATGFQDAFAPVKDSMPTVTQPNLQSQTSAQSLPSTSSGFAAFGTDPFTGAQAEAKNDAQPPPASFGVFDDNFTGATNMTSSDMNPAAPSSHSDLTLAPVKSQVDDKFAAFSSITEPAAPPDIPPVGPGPAASTASQAASEDKYSVFGSTNTASMADPTPVASAGGLDPSTAITASPLQPDVPSKDMPGPSQAAPKASDKYSVFEGLSTQASTTETPPAVNLGHGDSATSSSSLSNQLPSGSLTAQHSEPSIGNGALTSSSLTPESHQFLSATRSLPVAPSSQFAEKDRAGAESDPFASSAAAGSVGEKGRAFQPFSATPPPTTQSSGALNPAPLAAPSVSVASVGDGENKEVSTSVTLQPASTTSNTLASSFSGLDFDDAFAAKAPTPMQANSSLGSFDSAFGMSAGQQAHLPSIGSGFDDAFGDSWGSSKPASGPATSGFGDAFGQLTASPGPAGQLLPGQTSKPNSSSSLSNDPFASTSSPIAPILSRPSPPVPQKVTPAVAAQSVPGNVIADPFGTSFNPTPVAGALAAQPASADPFGSSFASSSASRKQAPPAIPPTSRKSVSHAGGQSPQLAPAHPPTTHETPTPQPPAQLPAQQPLAQAPSKQPSSSADTGFGDVFAPFVPAAQSASQPVASTATTGPVAASTSVFPAVATNQPAQPAAFGFSDAFGDSFTQPVAGPTMQPAQTSSSSLSSAGSQPFGTSFTAQPQQPAAPAVNQAFGDAFTQPQQPSASTSTQPFGDAFTQPQQPAAPASNQAFGGAFSPLQPTAGVQAAFGSNTQAMQSQAGPAAAQGFGGTPFAPQPGPPAAQVPGQQPGQPSMQGFGGTPFSQPQSQSSQLQSNTLPAQGFDEPAFASPASAHGSQAFPTQAATTTDGAQPGLTKPQMTGAAKTEDKKKKVAEIQQSLVLDIDKEWADLMASSSPALKRAHSSPPTNVRSGSTGSHAQFSAMQTSTASPATSAFTQRQTVPAAAVMQPASNLQPAAASAFPQPAATPATVAQSKPADDSLAKTLSAVQELEFIPSSLGKVEPTAAAHTGASTAAPTLSHEEAEKARLERVAKMKTKIQTVPDFDKRQAMLEEKRAQREKEFIAKQEEAKRKQEEEGSAAAGVRRSSVLASKWEQQVGQSSQFQPQRHGSIESTKALERRKKEEEELKRRQEEHEQELRDRAAAAEKARKAADEELRKKAEKEREEAAAKQQAEVAAARATSPKTGTVPSGVMATTHQSSPQRPSIDLNKRPTAPRKNSLAKQWEQKFGGN